MTDSYPHHIDSEKGLLGSLVKDPTIVDRVGGINIDVFYLPAHKAIYEHLMQVFSDSGSIDWILLKESFLKIELEAVGGVETLNEIFDFVPSAGNWQHYLDILERDLRRRLAMQACDFIRGKAADSESGSDFQVLFERASKSINFHGRAPEIFLKDAIRSEIVDMLAGRVVHKFYILSGLKDLDAHLGGVFPGEMVVVASETSRGKSALGVQMGTHMALGDQALKVAIFSFEMEHRAILQRIISARAEVRMNAIRYSELSDRDIEKLRSLPDTVPGGRTMVIEDSFSLSIDGVLSRCRRLKASGQLHVIIVDYLQLVNPGNRNNATNRQQEVAEISRSLKLLAGQLNVVVIGLSQVNDSGQTRESRAIEQDADVVLKIQDDEQSESTTEREIIIRKNRSGARGKKIKVDFYGDYVSFANKS
jgi:replicative DNA helicase